MAINLFDANFYRAANSDLRNFSDAQALSHFQKYGLEEGRTFSRFVNLNFYRASNQDLANLGFNNRQLFDHLQNYGVSEERRFSPFIDLNFYRTNNSDLAQLNFNNEQLFEHLRNWGLGEGRSFSPLVDLNFYRTYNGDIASFNNEQLFDHLRNYGLREGRYFSPFVDLNIYRAANSDLNAAGFGNQQLLEHLAIYGMQEGRRFSVSFDSNYYRNANSDLASLSNSQLLEHFERYGLTEGRASSQSFNIGYYLNNNLDLKAANFNNSQAQQHFEIYGFREGRLATPSDSLLVAANPGNTLNTAYSLDVVNHNRTISEFVGSTDRDDYYRFVLTSTSNLNLSLALSGSSNYAYANTELIFDSNSNGQVDSGDTIDYGSSSSSISSVVGAGTYFIRVYTGSVSYNTNYTLGIAVTAIPTTTPRDPGNNLNNALDIGTVSSNSSLTEFVGIADRNDYYRFTIANTSNFNVSLNGLSDSAKVELIFDSNGNGQADDNETLDYKYASSYNNASISTILGAGTYFIRVNAYYSSSNTQYTLGVSATATPPTTPKDPGNTLSTALDIGVLSGIRSFSDFVGSVDRDDYYRFTLTNVRNNFNLSLYGLTDSTKVELIFDSNGNGQLDYYDTLNYDYGYSNDNASISSPLGQGTYFVRVLVPSYDNANTNYTLSLSA